MPNLAAMRAHRANVMISSTTRDFPEHRNAAIHAVVRRGMFPLVMEAGVATPADAIKFSLDLVNQAEVYIGIFGYRYGYIPNDPKNPDKISITEMEYRRAVERGIPVLLFLMGDDHPGTVKASEWKTFYETSPENEVKLKRLKDELTTKYVVSFFNSSQELGSQIYQALTELKERGQLKVEMEQEIELAENASLQAQTPEKVASDISPIISVETLREQWLILQRTVRRLDTHLPALLDYAWASRVIGNVLIIGVSHPVFREKLERPERLKALEQALHTVFKVQLHVQIIMEDQPSRINESGNLSDPPASFDLKLGDENLPDVNQDIDRNDPLVSLGLEMGGEFPQSSYSSVSHSTDKLSPALGLELEEKLQPQRWLIVYYKRSGDDEKDRRRLRKLHGILTSYPGEDRFTMVVEGRKQSLTMEFPFHTTAYCDDLIQDLSNAVGSGNIRISERPS